MEALAPTHRAAIVRKFSSSLLPKDDIKLDPGGQESGDKLMSELNPSQASAALRGFSGGLLLLRSRIMCAERIFIC
jgi:hypothetical protein